jgi:hypothetical protein
MLPSLQLQSPQDVPPFVGKLVLDRALVRPGETLYVSGYVQRRDGNGLALPGSGASAALVVTPNPTPGGSGDPLVLPVALDGGRYGSLHGRVRVPASAELGDYNVALQVTPAAGGKPLTVGDSESFTTADPRPPTAALNVTAPKWAPPQSAVAVRLEARSYIGASVGGAPISYTWSTSLAAGQGNVTTNASGVAIARIPLGQLPKANISQPGDVLSVRLFFCVWGGFWLERGVW